MVKRRTVHIQFIHKKAQPFDAREPGLRRPSSQYTAKHFLRVKLYHTSYTHSSDTVMSRFQIFVSRKVNNLSIPLAYYIAQTPLDLLNHDGLLAVALRQG